MGRPDLRSSASEVQGLAGTANRDVIGPLHREADIHGASRLTAQQAPSHSSRPTPRYLSPHGIGLARTLPLPVDGHTPRSLTGCAASALSRPLACWAGGV